MMALGYGQATPRHNSLAYMQSGTSKARIDDFISDGAEFSLVDDISMGSFLQTKKIPKYTTNSSRHNATFVAELINDLRMTFSATIAQPLHNYASNMQVDDYSNRDDRNQCSNAIEAKINAFLALPDDWDGDGGVAPSRDAGSGAKLFLAILAPSRHFPHEIQAIGDGEIVFQWCCDRIFIETAFKTGIISWYVRIADEQAIFGDDGFNLANPTVDARLMQAIQQII